MDKSLVYLHDNLPQWLHDVGRLQDQVTALQDRRTTVVVSRSPFAQTPSCSVDAIRPGPMDAIAEETWPSPATQTDPLEDGNPRPPSVLSGRISAPSAAYRSRTMVVVSYDGEMQKSLELLVRAIGVGRSLLRKARLASKMNRLAALAGSSDEDEDEDEDEEYRGHSEEDELVPKSSHRPRMSSTRARAVARTSGRLGVTNGLDTPIALFEATDKTLERAQDLCEKAAHLTLREGDCRKELAHVRKGFEAVLRTAETERIRCNAHKSQEIADLHLYDTSDTSLSSLETPCEDVDSSISMPTCAPEPPAKVPQLAGLTPMPPDPGMYAMEVDEDEDEPLDLAMMPVRLTSRMHVRA